MAGEILVSVDGSEGSRRALRWSARLVERTGRRLRAIRAWRYPRAAPMDFFATTTLESPRSVDVAIEHALREIVEEELGERASRVRVSALRGDSAGALVAAARRVDASLLVVGARGLGGFPGMTLGSVARTVLEHAVTPVAVVRRPEPLGRRPVVLVGVDASPGSATALGWAAALAAEVHGEIHAIHAFHPHALPVGASREELRAEAQAVLEARTPPLREGAIPFRAKVVDGDPRQVLLDAAERERPWLVVVASRGRGLVTILLGSVPTFLAQRLPGVLAVVPPVATPEAPPTSG